MPDSDAIFTIKTRVDDRELYESIARANQAIARVTRQVASGTLTPQSGRQVAVSVGAQAQALQSALVASAQGTPQQLAILTGVINSVKSAFAGMRDAGVKVERAELQFETEMRAALRNLARENTQTKKGPQTGDERYASQLATIRSRTIANARLVDDAEAQAARTEQANAKQRLKQDDKRLDNESRRTFADEIDRNKQESARLTAEENARMYKALNADEDYIKSRINETADRRRLGARVHSQVAQQLQVDGDYIRDTANQRIANRRTRLSVDTLVEAGTTAADIAVAGDLAANQRRRAVNEARVTEQALSTDQEFLEATGELAAARRRRVRGEREQFLYQSRGDIQQEGELAAAERRRRTAIDAATERAITPRDAQLAGQLAGNRRRRAVAEARAMEASLAADRSFIEATAQLNAARRRRAVEERRATIEATSAGDIDNEARLRLDEEAQRAALAARQARLRDEDPDVGRQAARTIEDQARVAAQKQLDAAQRRARTQELLGNDEATLRANLAAAKVAEKERALAVQRLVRETLGTAGIEAQAKEDVAQAAAAEKRRLSVLRRTLGNEEGLLTLKSQSLVANRQLVEAERRLANAAVRQAVASGQVARGTLVQRVQAYVAQRGGGNARLPDEYATGRQILTGSLLTSARFGLSGALLYGALSQMRELVREASELQVQLGIVRGVLESTGQSGEEAFQRVREGVLDVSLATATAADEVANVQRQLAGAFANEQGVPDFGRARVESEAAFQLARVAGLPTQEITDSLTAVSLAFGHTEPSFESISDLIVGLEDRFGVLSTEIVRFVADLAPLGAELGFTADELAIFGAAAQQASGQSGGSLAEQFRRIIPGIQDRATDIIGLFSGGVANELATSFGANDVSNVFRLLLQNYDQLDQAGRNQLATLVGGRREAGAFLAVLNRGPQVIAALEGGTEQFSGALQNRFDEVSQSVTFAFEQLQRTVEEFGIALFDAGLADALVALADAGRLVFEGFSGILSIANGVNDFFGGLPSKILAIVAAVRLLAFFTGGGAAGTSARAGAALGQSAFFTGLLGGAGVSPTAAVAPTAGQPQLPLVYGTGSPLSAAQMRAHAAEYGAIERRNAASAQAATRAQLIAARESVGLRQPLSGTTRSQIASLMRNSSYASATAIGGFVGSAFVQAFNENGENATLNAVQGALQGAALGATIASVIPGVGTLLGAGIGAAAGGLLSILGGGGDEEGPHDLADEITTARFQRRLPAYQALIGDDEEDRELRQEFARGGSIRQSLRQDIERILGDIEANGLTNLRYDVLRNMLGDAGIRSDELDEINRAIRDRQDELEEAVLESGESRLSLQDTLSAFDRGQAVRADVIDSFTADQRSLTAQLEGAQETGNEARVLELQEAIAQSEQAEREFVTGLVSRRFDLFSQISDVLGGERASPEGELRAASDRLAALQAVGANREDITAAAFGVLQAQRAILNDEIESAEGFSAQMAIANRGLAADANAANAIAEDILSAVGARDILQDALGAITAPATPLRGFFNNPARNSPEQAAVLEEINDRSRAVAESLNIDVDDNLRLMQEAIATTGLLESKVYQTIITALRARLEALHKLVIQAIRNLDPAEFIRVFTQVIGVVNSLNNLNSLAAEVGSGLGTVQGDTSIDDSTADVDDLARRVADARIAVERARANGDPVRLAQLAREAALIQIQYAKDEAEELQGLAALIEADNQLRDALNDIVVAELELAAARTGDPVEDARINLQIADNAVATAVGTAAQYRALAQQAEAELAFRDAIRDVFQSQLDLAIAIANAAGDDVAAAELAHQQALAELDRATSEGLGEAAVNAAQAEVVATAAGIRDASLANQRDLIDYQLELGEITTQQAIAAYQSLLSIPDLTEDQIREINRIINGLRDELGRDFRFNLPSLALPTPYEVRRLGGSSGGGAQVAGGGYQDNRTITVNITTGSGNPEEIANIVADRVAGQPRRNATYVRRI